MTTHTTAHFRTMSLFMYLIRTRLEWSPVETLSFYLCTRTSCAVIMMSCDNYVHFKFVSSLIHSKRQLYSCMLNELRRVSSVYLDVWLILCLGEAPLAIVHCLCVGDVVCMEIVRTTVLGMNE